MKMYRFAIAAALACAMTPAAVSVSSPAFAAGTRLSCGADGATDFSMDARFETRGSRRNGDVRLLSEHFLSNLASRYGKRGMCFSEAAAKRLSSHDWPGNVRELKNTLEQAVLMTTGEVVNDGDLSIASYVDFADTDPPPVASAPSAGRDRGLTEIEREAIVNALDRSNGNVTRAARLLRISRDTLRYRIEKYSLR